MEQGRQLLPRKGIGMNGAWWVGMAWFGGREVGG
jgi:hypothetical protein